MIEAVEVPVLRYDPRRVGANWRPLSKIPYQLTHAGSDPVDVGKLKSDIATKVLEQLDEQGESDYRILRVTFTSPVEPKCYVCESDYLDATEELITMIDLIDSLCEATENES